MKKTSLVLLLMIVGAQCFAQFGVSIHQSNLPFLGLNYQIKDKFIPEVRVGVDNYIENLSLEATVSYIFLKNEVVNAYGGLGARGNVFGGVVIPAGINIYPFEHKNFGFQMEVAVLGGEGTLLRGSWGIRYRFKKNE